MLLKDMDQEEGQLRRKLANLLELRDQLTHQDEVLKGLQSHSQPWQGAPEPVMNVMRRLFTELADALPEKRISFDDNNDIDGLRSQLALVRSKVQSDIAAICEAIGDQPPEARSMRVNESIHIEPSEPAGKRRVFVVHGRNIKTKDAMFGFLRALDLDPIEWDEAIPMAGGTSPYMGRILDNAFSKAQAVVILITGDDVARLDEQFVKDHDPDHEKQLTPQARPNVIFEMGMAFGKYPDRTIIVEFGYTRPFSDLAGRNTIHFADDPSTRKKIADRLRYAGCLVRTDDRSDWLKAGDFSSAFHPPVHRRALKKRKYLIEDAAIESIDCITDYHARRTVVAQNEAVHDESDLFYLLVENVISCEETRNMIKDALHPNNAGQLFPDVKFEISGLYDTMGKWDVLARFRAPGFNRSKDLWKYLSTAVLNNNPNGELRLFNIDREGPHLSAIQNGGWKGTLQHRWMGSTGAYRDSRCQRFFLYIELPELNRDRRLLIKELDDVIGKSAVARIIESVAYAEQDRALMFEIFTTCSDALLIHELNRLVESRIPSFKKGKSTLCCFESDERS